MSSFSRLLLGGRSEGDAESSRSKRAQQLEGVRSPRNGHEMLVSRASLLSELPETHPLKEGFSFGRADAIYSATLAETEQRPDSKSSLKSFLTSNINIHIIYIYINK